MRGKIMSASQHKSQADDCNWDQVKIHDGTAWGWYLFLQEKRLIVQKAIQLLSRSVSGSFDVAVGIFVNGFVYKLLD
jgi:hypothetical protein